MGEQSISPNHNGFNDKNSETEMEEDIDNEEEVDVSSEGNFFFIFVVKLKRDNLQIFKRLTIN